MLLRTMELCCAPLLGSRTRDSPGAAWPWLAQPHTLGGVSCLLLAPWIIPLASCHLSHPWLSLQLDGKPVLSHGREELHHSRGFHLYLPALGLRVLWERAQRQRQTNLPCWELQLCQDVFILLCKKCEQGGDPAPEESR